MNPITSMMPPTQAQHLPRTELRRGLESGNVSIDNGTQDVNLERGRTEGIALSDVRGIETDVSANVSSKEVAFERFMQEIVTVQMMPAANENDHQFAEVTVNGVYRCLRMGEQYDIPRTHLAALAQAKAMRLEQQKVVNADGSMGYQEKAVMRQMYPFSIVHDPNPHGAKWLMPLLKNPA